MVFINNFYRWREKFLTKFVLKEGILIELYKLAFAAIVTTYHVDKIFASPFTLNAPMNSRP